MRTVGGAKSEADREAEYRAKDDARTLTEAEAVHSDPKRLDGAHKHLRHAQDALHRTLGRIGKRMKSRGSSRK